MYFNFKKKMSNKGGEQDKFNIVTSQPKITLIGEQILKVKKPQGYP